MPVPVAFGLLTLAAAGEHALHVVGEVLEPDENVLVPFLADLAVGPEPLARTPRRSYTGRRGSALVWGPVGAHVLQNIRPTRYSSLAARRVAVKRSYPHHRCKGG